MTAHAVAGTITRAFDPADSGTSEAHWRASLDPVDEWCPADGPLVVVSPHPDDEVLGCGGLIHAWAVRGLRVTVLSVTDGEAAFPAWQELGRVRRDELRDALRRLSPIHIDLVRLGLPDGAVGAHRNRLHNALLPLLAPGTLVLAPFEHDGHPDHDATGAVCRALSDSHGVAVARYPIWLWHHATAGALHGLTLGRFALSPDAQRAKARAARCFASQLSPPHGDPVVPAHVLEHFNRPYEVFIL